MQGYNARLERRKILRYHALGKWKETEKMASALLPQRYLPTTDSVGNRIGTPHAIYSSCLADIARMRIITDPTYAEWFELNG